MPRRKTAPKKRPPRTSAPKPPPGRGLAGSAVAVLLGLGGAYAALASCGRSGEPPQPPSATSSAVAPGAAAMDPPSPGSGGKGLTDPTDGGGNNLVEIPADAFTDDKEAGSSTHGVLLGAAHFQTHVFEAPNYSSPRIGYLRAGAKVPIKDAVAGEAVKRVRSPSCKEGWVAVVPRGYVCLDKGGGSLNLEAPNVRLATAPPAFEELLPYKYAFNWRNGAPLYRKVPTAKEWQEYEPWMKPQPKVDKKKKADDDPYGDEVDSGVVAELDAAVAGESDASVPWWEKDAGKDKISLKETMVGEGLVARRMAKGFAISIDRSFSWYGRNWHRTTMGLVAPADSVSMIKAPEYKGVELGTDFQLPLAWSLIKEAGIFESKDKKTFAIKDRFKKQTPIRLLSPTAPGYEEVKSGQFTYLPTNDGRWVRAQDVTRIDLVAPPDGLKPNEKWIDVSIKAQALVAYEGTKPVFATLVSTGKDGTNLKGQFATVQGSFRVREKHVAATMDGDTAGELYSIDDVPYIQYFHTSYALHGAFWHSDYGRVRSHGCVNLSPSDSKRLFFWTEPQLPTGWHAVWSSEAHPGTRVITRP